MIRILAIGLRLLAALYRLLPCKQRVVLLSRQNGKVSLDFQMLAQKLQGRIGKQNVVVHVMKSELAGKGAFVSGTLAQLKLASTSKVIVMDGYLPAVCIPKKRAGTTAIQMWHSPGAIKKFGYQSIDTPAGRPSEYARVARMHKNYDWIVAGGAGFSEAYAQAFGYTQHPECILALGLPHFEYLLDTSSQSPRLEKAQHIAAKNDFFSNGRMNILYAPTLRKGAEYHGWLSKQVELLAQACPADAVNLAVAGHPLDHDFDTRLLERYPHIRFVTGVATMDLLELADCVISDYSGVALDAGIMGKPVLFYVPDIEQYRASPGLNIDPINHELLTASVNAEDLMGICLDANALQAAREAYAEFIDRCFDGACDKPTERIAELVVRYLSH